VRAGVGELGRLADNEIAAMETRVEKEVCFLRTYAVVTTLFCGGEEISTCRQELDAGR